MYLKAVEVERAMSSELQALKQELQQKGSHNREQDEELISAMREQVTTAAHVCKHHWMWLWMMKAGQASATWSFFIYFSAISVSYGVMKLKWSDSILQAALMRLYLTCFSPPFFTLTASCTCKVSKGCFCFYFYTSSCSSITTPDGGWGVMKGSSGFFFFFLPTEYIF